jgi:hypothetical protein
MKIEILRSAMQDLLEGSAFYERQREGLGAYFMDALFSDIDALQLFGGVHARFFGRFHRTLSKRFPFAIYYTFEGTAVLVHAVLDCRRDPERTDTRLQERSGGALAE